MLGKRLAIVAIGLTTAALLLSGCPAPTPQIVEVEKQVVVEKEKPVEIVVTATPAPETIKISFMSVALREAPGVSDLFMKVMDEFEASHPNVDVEWIDVATNIREWIYSNMAAGTLPDIVDTNPTLGLADMADLGAWVPLDDYITPEIRARYGQGSWDGGTFRGKIYGLPFYAATRVLFWNKEIFEEAGLDPEKPPVTIDEFFDMAKVIHEETGKYGFSFYTSMRLQNYMTAAGIPWLTPDGTQAAINTPEAAALIQQFVDAYQEGILPPEASLDLLASDTYADVNWFASGEAGLFMRDPYWPRMLPDEMKVYPDGPVGVGNGIIGPPGKYVMDVGHYFAISSQSAHPDIAFEFAQFLVNDEHLLEFGKGTGVPPVSIVAAQDPVFHQEPADIRGAAGQVSMAQAGDSISAGLLPHFSELNDVLVEYVQVAMLGDMTVEEALEAVEAEWNSILGG